MADRIHLDRLDEPLASVARAAFPNYRGRKFALVPETELDVRSYWDGGSRDYFTCVELSTMRTLSMPPQSAFDRPVAGADRAPVPDGYLWVEHSIFCGKDAGLTFHVNPANLTKMLPGQADEPELTWAEQVVLAATGYKSSYGGIPNFRRHLAKEETGITGLEYDAAKQELIRRGYLTVPGAITVKGKNARPDRWPTKRQAIEEGTR